MSSVYDQKKIDALASELMEPQRLAEGGPPRSRIAKAAAAVRRSIGDEPLEGAPTRANVPNVGEVMLGRNREAEEAARRAAEMSGVPYQPTTRYAPVDVDRATRIAREYDLMKHDPDDPMVKRAYEQMIKETNDQYEAMLQAGIEPYFIDPANDPYRNSPYEALLDVAENRRLGVFPSVEGFGTDPNFNPAGNPMLQETGRMISGRPALANDLFRAVHDYFGHAKPGVGFRAAGEENAYQSHAGMFSPLARRALASETRGQNSWLNYGPYGETNRTARIEDTRFADQKAGLMPRWASEAGLVINDDRRREFFDNLARNRTGLEGAISDDGKLRLVHYSSRPLERIDPEFYGRGLSRASLAERNRSYDPEFVKRSYYGIPASENPYVPEFGLGGIRNEVLIEPELIYQAQANPEGLWLPDDPTGSERRIAESGYTGYYTNHPKLGKVAVIFDPYDVTKTYMVPVGAVGAGVMALSGEEEPETMAKGGLVDKLRSAASSVKEAGNVYKAAVGNMFSPFEPTEPQLGDPNDYEFPELRLRRPGIVNLALGMPNMPSDLRDLFGVVKDVATGDKVPDESWRRFDTATEAQGRYEDDMDAFLRAYTGNSVDELSAPMSAVLGVSEALAQPGIIPAKLVAGLPRAARYLSNLAEFATPVTVASPGAMLSGAGVSAGFRSLPALLAGDDLEQMNARYSGRELSGEEQARLDDYLQELLGKKDGMVEPELLAGGGAIRKAAEAIRGAAKSAGEALDMSAEGRKRRAAQQGFNVDEVLYHGTDKSFENFIPKRGLSGTASYLTPDADIASAYAMGDVRGKKRGDGANILPAYVRGNILSQQDLTRGQEIDIWKAIEEYELANAKPGTLKYEMLTDKMFPSMSESLLETTDEEYVPDFVQMMEKLAEIKRTEDILGGLGYTGVRGLEELINARNRPGLKEYESIAVFDPKNIRSVNARFNPLDIDSSNILSGLGAAAIGAGALTNEDDPDGMSKGGLVYDADAINALANELMEPQEFAGGGKIRRAAAAIRGGSAPPPPVADELSVSDEDMMRIAQDLGVDETIMRSDVPIQPTSRTGYGRSTIRGAGRKTIPGIYDDPRLIVERASAAVAPESEAMQQLFGVTREDLAKVAMEREPVVWSPPGAPARPRGTDYAALVMQPANTQRLVDILDEASESPLRAGMTGWYMLDPAYRRLVELVGEEEAKKLFVDMNTLTGVHSANAAVANELTRGTAMNWLNRENRLDDYVKYGAKAGMEGAPADMATIPGHLAHKTAHIIPALRYLETGELSKEAKTPAYITASNPPEIGTNVNFPVGDAHFVRAIGLSDVRPETKNPSARFASWSMPEAMQLNDWFTSDVARRAGLSGVSAQALLWGALSPTTGVKSKIGAPKLEILADLIMQTAKRLNVSPEEARDMVLLGRAYAGKAAGGLVGYKQQISGEM